MSEELRRIGRGMKLLAHIFSYTLLFLGVGLALGWTMRHATWWASAMFIGALIIGSAYFFGGIATPNNDLPTGNDGGRG